MTGWSIAAGLLGIVVGVVGKYLADLRANRTNRLMDEKIKQAVRFLETADRLRRKSEVSMLALTQLNNVDHGDQVAYGHLRDLYAERLHDQVPVFTDAEDAYNAVRLLIPTAAESARRYLDLCAIADPRPEYDQAPRLRARQTVEEAIRTALGV